MAQLIRVPGKTGGFVEHNGTLRYTSGAEWSSLTAKQAPVTMDESTFATRVYSAKSVTSSAGDISSLMNSDRLNSSIARKYSGPATATQPAVRNPTTTTSKPSAPRDPSDVEKTPAQVAEEAEIRRDQMEAQRRAEADARRARDLVATLHAEFPWLEDIGLDAKWFQQTAANASGASEMLVKLRATPQYKKRFPGMYREDGSVRMNEAQYMAREQDFRTLLNQYGFDASEYSEPAQLVGFFSSDMDPNEFRQRLETYRGVQQGSRAKKDAFYVYAGLDVSDDDLYMAIVDPAAAQNLSDKYNEAIANGAMDYGTWITRATEVGARRVADTLGALQRQGAMTGRAIQSVLKVNPEFARRMMDAIYTGGTGDASTQTLSLEDLLSSFEYAMIGAAASEAGLAMPTKERLAEIRQAGVERARAIQGYQQFGMDQGVISASVQRAGYDEFTQDEFERARFLGEGSLNRELQEGLALEEAAGMGSGEFRFSESGGRLVQRGFGRRV